MIKILLLTYTLFLINFKSNAQFSSVDWTDAFELEETTIFVGNYCDGGNKTTLLFADNESAATKINLVFIDLSTNASVIVKYNFKTEVNSIIGGYNKQNSFVVFYDIISEKANTFSYEIKSLEINQDKTNEEKLISKFTSDKKAHFGKSKFSQSPNLKKTLLFIESPFVNGQKESVTMLIYDQTGKEESSNTLPMDIDSKLNVHNYPEVTNNGGVFFLKKDKEKNQYRYFIYSFNPSLKDFNHKLIALANAHITEITGQVTNQNEFLVGGFTASDPVHVYEGYYMFKFDQTCIQKFKTQGQLDEQTFLRFLSKKEFSNDPAIKNFYLDNIILLESGKMFLAAEMYTQDVISDDVTWTNYKDLMLVCFDAAGKYKTTFNYKKNQSQIDENSDWASYQTIPYADSVIIAHNFIVKTEGEKNPEPLFSLVKVHEKFSTKIMSTSKIGSQGDTPFFIPKIVYNTTTKQTLCLFADFKRNKFRLGIFNL